MLLASYGQSEHARNALIELSIGDEVIGSAARSSDPNGLLLGLEDFVYVITSGYDNHPADNAVGVIEMPDGSFFTTVPERVPPEVRPHVAATFMVHYLAELDFDDAALITLRGIRNDLKEPFTRAVSLCLSSAREGLIGSDPIDLMKQTGEPLADSIRGIRIGEGVLFERLPEVLEFNRSLFSGSRLNLQRLGLTLAIGDNVAVRKFHEGREIKNISLSVEKSKNHKIHVCNGCHGGIVGGALRTTIGTVERSGFDHHHYHAFCSAFIF